MRIGSNRAFLSLLLHPHAWFLRCSLSLWPWFIFPDVLFPCLLKFYNICSKVITTVFLIHHQCSWVWRDFLVGEGEDDKAKSGVGNFSLLVVTNNLQPTPMLNKLFLLCYILCNTWPVHLFKMKYCFLWWELEDGWCRHTLSVTFFIKAVLSCLVGSIHEQLWYEFLINVFMSYSDLN